MNYTPAQKLLGSLLLGASEELYRRLKEEFPDPKDIPSCDEQARVCFGILYKGGLCDLGDFTLRASGQFSVGLDKLVKAAGKWKGEVALSELIREKNRQNILTESAKLQSKLTSEGTDPLEARAEFISATEPVGQAKQAYDWQNHVTESEASMLSAEAGGLELTSGLRPLDDLYLWRRKNVTIVAGATSHCKTAKSLNMATRAAKQGLRVGYLAFEDYATLPFKMASQLYKVPLDYFTRYYGLSKEDKEKVQQNLVKLRQYENIKVLPPMSLGEFEVEMNSFKPDLIIFDYIQRYVERYGKSEKHNDIGKAADTFHRLTEKYNAYGVLVSQIRRRENTKYGAGPPRRPQLFDLKESGDLENYADGVLLLWYPWKDDPHNYQLDHSDYRIEVAKNKLGQCGEAKVIFDGTTQSFRDYGQ